MIRSDRKTGLDSIRGIALTAMLGAILFAVQVALAVLPNIEIVSLLIIVYTVVLKTKALPAIYVFVVLEGFVYGFSTWFINYLYIWAVLFAVVMVCDRLGVRSAAIWAVISGIYGLMFGALCAPVYLFIGGPGAAFSYWINGLPFDFAHCAGNFVTCLVLFKPLTALLGRLYQKI